jgi:hypothetical protein
MALGIFVFWLTSNQVKDQVVSAVSSNDVIVIDGLLNIWASVGGLLLFTYFSVYAAKNEFELSISMGNLNKIGITIAFIISPLLAMGTYSQAKANVADYVECKSERKLSSRYSSRTYARTEELCLSLEDNKS